MYIIRKSLVLRVSRLILLTFVLLSLIGISIVLLGFLKTSFEILGAIILNSIEYILSIIYSISLQEDILTTFNIGLFFYLISIISIIKIDQDTVENESFLSGMFHKNNIYKEDDYLGKSKVIIFDGILTDEIYINNIKSTKKYFNNLFFSSLCLTSVLLGTFVFREFWFKLALLEYQPYEFIIFNILSYLGLIYIAFIILMIIIIGMFNLLECLYNLPMIESYIRWKEENRE